ncbi:MAG: hypothetical protein JSR73_08695 [Proteobacteria bacterium]|nr:hypothetical protein [Pseudomonadota bacterium]
MHDHPHSEIIPPALLLGAAAMIVGAILLASLGRLTGVGRVGFDDSRIVTARELRFLDGADGSVEVLEGGAAPLARLAPGTNGFARGLLRGFARERLREGRDRSLPFTLARHADGRLTLDDPSTGRKVDLDVFGPTNALVFARLLLAPPTGGTGASAGAGSLP